MNKKILSLLICVTVVGSLFSGCSNLNNVSEEKANSADASTIQTNNGNNTDRNSSKADNGLKNDDSSSLNLYLKKLDTIEKYDIKRNKESSTTLEIAQYAHEVSKMYDELLNDIYNYLKKNMSEDEFKKIEKDEVNWVNQKEEAVKKVREDKEKSGGSMSAYAEPLTVMNYTHNRIYELLKYMGYNELQDKEEAQKYLISEDEVYINNILSSNGSLNYIKIVKLDEIEEKFLLLSNVDEQFFQFSLEDEYKNKYNYYIGKISRKVYLSSDKEKTALLEIKDGKVVDYYDNAIGDKLEVWR